MAEVNVNERIPAFDIFLEQFRGVFDNLDAEQTWLRSMYEASRPYYIKGYVDGEIPEMLLNDADKNPQLQPFRDRFAGIYKLRERRASGQNVAYIPTIAEYLVMDRQMKREFKKYGLNELANNASVADVIGNDVDFEEMKSRMSDAFFAIDSADEFLKNELKTNFPTIGRTDLAMALLKGETGAQELKKKVEVAGIRAGAAEFGFQLQTSAEELQKMGADRAKVRAGYEKIRTELPGLQTAGGLFGTQGNLQKSLEEETILDKASTEAKRLRSQARAQFGGVTGTSSGSLQRKRQVV